MRVRTHPPNDRRPDHYPVMTLYPTNDEDRAFLEGMYLATNGKPITMSLIIKEEEDEDPWYQHIMEVWHFGAITNRE